MSSIRRWAAGPTRSCGAAGAPRSRVSSAMGSAWEPPFSFSFRRRAFQMRIERVVEEGRSCEDVGVILPDDGESLTDGPETGRLPGDVHLGGKVGPVNDPAQASERFVIRHSFLDQRLEGAAAALIAMRVGRARSVETDRSFSFLHAGYLLRLDEEDLGLGVQEAPDEPAGRRAVDMDAFTRDPFHRPAPLEFI